MKQSRLMIMLISLLTFGLLSLGTSVQASVPENSTHTITLEKTVQFVDPQGEEVLVGPGSYAVTAGKETLQLVDTETSTSFTIEADENSHKADIPLPAAASIPGQDGPLAKLHSLILFLPDGHALQAIGTYPGIRSRGIPVETELSGSPITVTFEKAVHFIAPDGSPIIAEPGSYTAEVAQDWIRLVPGEERHNALLIEAQKGTNDTEVDELIALSLPGSSEKELDLHHVMLLLPTGQTLEATGSYSGIHPRNWFKKTFKKAKRTVGRTYKKAGRTVRKAGKTVRKTAKKVGKTVGKTAKKVGKGVGKTAKKVGKDIGKTAKQVGKGVGHAAKKVGKGVSQAALQAKHAAEQAAKFAAKQAKYVAQKAAILACKGFFAGQAAVAKLSEGAMKIIKKQVNKVRKNSKLLNDVVSQVETIQKKQQQIIDKAVKSSLKFHNPKMLQQLTEVVKPNNICENGISGTKKNIKALFATNNKVRSRGLFGTTTSIGAQGAGTFKFGGLEAGMGVAWKGGTRKNYWFVGGTAQLPQLSGKLLVQFGKWQKLASLQGGYLAVGVTFPLHQWAKIAGWVPGDKGVPPFKGGGGNEINITIDFLFSMDFTKKNKGKPFTFAGIVVSPGVSFGLANTSLAAGPLGRVTIQSGYGGFTKMKL